MNNVVCIIAATVILILIFCSKRFEGYNDQTGTLCVDCYRRTPNQCLQCFNCGICEDEWGNRKCIGGDYNSGPYNKEKCHKFYTGSPFYNVNKKNDLKLAPKLRSCRCKLMNRVRCG